MPGARNTPLNNFPPTRSRDISILGRACPTGTPLTRPRWSRFFGATTCTAGSGTPACRQARAMAGYSCLIRFRSLSACTSFAQQQQCTRHILEMQPMPPYSSITQASSCTSRTGPTPPPRWRPSTSPASRQASGSCSRAPPSSTSCECWWTGSWQQSPSTSGSSLPGTWSSCPS